MTINAGVRFDALEDIVPAQTIGPGPQVPTRNLTFGEVTACRSGRTSRPRLGAAYDLFGNGRTAVKFSIGKYLEAPNPPTFTRAANPAGGLVQSATRTWTDRNNDFVPQASELGALNPTNFGTTDVSSRYADEVLTSRMSNWELAAQVQHEIVPADVGERRLLPALVRQPARDGQPVDHAGRLQPVLREGASRLATAGRRRLHGHAGSTTPTGS